MVEIDTARWRGRLPLGGTSSFLTTALGGAAGCHGVFLNVCCVIRKKKACM